MRRRGRDLVGMRALRAISLCAVVFAGRESAAQEGAHAVPQPRVRVEEIELGRFEIGASAGWAGGNDLGTARGTLPSPGGPAPALYEATAAISGGPTADVRVAWRFWRSLSIEGAGEFARLHLESEVVSAIEPALNAAVEMPFSQLTARAGLFVPLHRRAARGGRLMPFVTAGGGYFWQADEEDVRLETGRLAYGGGGLRWTLGTPGRGRFFKQAGLRFDGRLVLRDGGIDVEDRRRWSGVLTAGAFVRF